MPPISWWNLCRSQTARARRRCLLTGHDTCHRKGESTYIHKYSIDLNRCTPKSQRWCHVLCNLEVYARESINLSSIYLPVHPTLYLCSSVEVISHHFCTSTHRSPFIYPGLVPCLLCQSACEHPLSVPPTTLKETIFWDTRHLAPTFYDNDRLEHLGLKLIHPANG